ncbi:MAG TPA: hypothetical protein VFV08_04240, partial [Puia sp.]|nr:hypothetical protein [Puia sp.]
NLKKDKSKLEILKKVYGITEKDIDGVIAEIKNVKANPFYSAPLSYLPVFKADDKKYYNVAFSNLNGATPVSFEPNTVSGPLEIPDNLPQPEIDFTLSETNPYKKMILGWLIQTKKTGYPHTTDFSQFTGPRKISSAKADFLNMYATNAEKKIKAASEPTLANVKLFRRMKIEIDSINNDLDRFLSVNNSIINLPEYKNWILQWLWYQNSALPSINPLGFKNTGDLGQEPDTSSLEGLRIKIASRQKIFEGDLGNFKVKQLDSIINETDSLKKTVFDIQKSWDSYTHSKENNAKLKDEFTRTSALLNTAILIAGKKSESTYWIRHHNALAKYELMNDLEKREYLETDQVVILSHNLRPNESSDAHVSLSDITNDQSQIADEVGPVISQLASAVQSFKLGANPSRLPLSISYENAKDSANRSLSQLWDKVKELKILNECLQYLQSQSNPDLDIEEQVDKSLAFHSQVANPAKKTDGPKKVTYYINTISDQGTKGGAGAA